MTKKVKSGDDRLRNSKFPASLRGSKATEARNSRILLRNSRFYLGILEFLGLEV